MKLSLISQGTLALSLVFCAACNRPPAAPTSAAGHDQEAREEERAAATHLSSYDPLLEGEHCNPSDVTAVDMVGCWSSWRAPRSTWGADLVDAREHLRVAALHRATSAALRDAEANACKGIPERDKAISPFWHRKDIVEITPVYEPLGTGETPGAPKGAVITFAPVPGMTSESLQRLVDCHLARNAALGHQVPQMPYCPLVPANVAANVVPTPQGGLAVVLTSTDRESAREVIARARKLEVRRGGLR